MSDPSKKPVDVVNDEPPSSPTRRVNNSKQSLTNEAETLFKPFQGNGEKKGATDSPEGDIEDKGGTPPIPAQDLNVSSALVAGSNIWSPEMGIKKFRFSHCREWKLSEFVAPKWSLSQVVAPETFQKYSIPFPRE